MRHTRYIPKPLSLRASEPFPSAEEAWLWFSQCQLARVDGVRFVADSGAIARPCEPDDIYRAVDRLYRQRRLQRAHLAVLGHFGKRLSPPDRRPGGDGLGQATLWDEALDRLSGALRAKGIVA
ncbi:MAG: hypothetical protein HY985_10950 [Magnetospirillum sp.]|nr:hypothetical protein [Magnetospirillum sp.]